MAASYPIQVRIGATDGASGPIRAAAGRISGALSGIGGRLSGLTARLGSAAASAAKVASVAGAAAAVALVYAGTQLLDNFVETGDELMKFSAQTGISVEKIQELRSAANFSDIETGTFNSGMLAFAKALAKARNETGPLVKGLKKTEPALLAQLKATTSVEAGFLKYVEAMENAKNEESRLELAGFAFGGAGNDMALLGEMGKAKVEEEMEKRRKLGVTSTEAAKKAADLDDQLARLGQRWTMVKLRIGEAIGDAIGPLLTKLGEWYDANQDLINQRIEGTIQTIARAVKKVWEYLKSIDWAAIWAGAKETWDNISAGLAKLDSFVQSVFGGWGTALAVLFGAKALATIATFVAAARAALGLKAATAAAAAGGTAAATAATGFAASVPVAAAIFAQGDSGMTREEHFDRRIEDVDTGSFFAGRLFNGRHAAGALDDIPSTYLAQTLARGPSSASYDELSRRGASFEALEELIAARTGGPDGTGDAIDLELAAENAARSTVRPLEDAITTALGYMQAGLDATNARAAALAPPAKIELTVNGLPAGATVTATTPGAQPTKAVARTGARNVGTAPP